MPEDLEPNSEKQLPLYLEKRPDDTALRDIRAITASKEAAPFEGKIDVKRLGQLALQGEEMERVLKNGNHRIREELTRRGVEKLKTIPGCTTYGRPQILEGSSMRSFHLEANAKEDFYIGIDMHADGVSAYDKGYPERVRAFGRRMEREHPGYLVTWDGRIDHPVNMWVPLSALE